MLKTRYLRLAACAIFLVVGPMKVHSQVVDSSASGFTSKNTVTIAASPRVVYRHLITNIGKWWDPEHTYSGVSENLYLEPKATGCFCERLRGGGSIQHLAVVYVEPDKIIRMSGALGPLQSMAAAGSFNVALTEIGNATKVELTYTVGGYHPGGFQSLASPVDRVLLLQLKRFKNYVETGKP